MKQKPPKYTIKNLRAEFPTDEACIEYIFKVRFPDPVCPECNAEKSFYRVTTRKCYSCSHCGYQIHPLAGTIFHKSSTKLTDWFHALFLFSASRNGVAATELQRQLGVTYKCAWRIAKQIRSLMGTSDKPFSGTVEVDETFIGGRAANKHKKHLAIYGLPEKTIVVGTLDRKGKVATKIVNNVRTSEVLPYLKNRIEEGSIVYTDDHPIYRTLPKLGYEHGSTAHSRGEYVKGEIHTNNIEGFWSQIKRSLNGTHHVVSVKYLPLYLAEFSFRYSHRDSQIPMFHLLLARA